MTKLLTILPAFVIEKMLKKKQHPEKRGMVNVYVCSHCHTQITFVYLDSGVTPDTIQCANCKKPSAHSCACRIDQPDSVWFRPKNMGEVKQIMENAFAHDEEQYITSCKKQGIGIKDLKKQILQNYIIHYNQGGLFSRKRV